MRRPVVRRGGLGRTLKYFQISFRSSSKTIPVTGATGFGLRVFGAVRVRSSAAAGPTSAVQRTKVVIARVMTDVLLKITDTFGEMTG